MSTTKNEAYVDAKKRKEHEHTEMRIIRTDNDIDWLPKPNKVTIMISDSLPERNLITCSFILAFSGDEVLITDLHARGLDIPGGILKQGSQQRKP